MIINIEDDSFESTKTPMVCVAKRKYLQISLGFDFGNVILPFAEINMSDGTYIKKEKQYAALVDLCNKIAANWNEKYGLNG